MRAELRWILLASLVTVGGCGGGDGSTGSIGSGGSGSGGTSGSWTAGVFEPSADFANQCASPRTGTDPTTGQALSRCPGLDAHREQLPALVDQRAVPLVPRGARPRSGVVLDRRLLQPPEDERRPRRPATRRTGSTSRIRPPSGWRCRSPAWKAGYGAQWIVIASRPPRQVVVAYTEPGSPATTPPANLGSGREGADRRRGGPGQRQRQRERRHAERGPLPVRGRRLPHLLHPRPRGERAPHHHDGLRQRDVDAGAERRDHQDRRRHGRATCSSTTTSPPRSRRW